MSATPVRTASVDHVIRSWTLPPTPGSAAAARAAVRAVLPPRGERVAPVAVLLTDELVVNAIRYGTGSVRLTLSVAPRRIRVTVGDDTSAPPVQIEADRERPRPSGRGLVLVEALATRWGVIPDGAGKRVWFELTWT